MTELFIYLLKAAIINGVIIGFYYFTLRESNKFWLMRITLLTAIILPIVIPLLPFGELNPLGRQMLPVIELSLTGFSENYSLESSYTILNLPPLHEFIYYSMATILLIAMSISILSIIKKRIRADKYNSSFGEVLLEKSVVSPFSFFSWVFVSSKQLDHPQINMLLRHEFCHVKEMHSIDRVLSGILRSLLWFSPFSHLTGKFLAQVHEYQADAAVLTDEFNKDVYSNLLLTFYFSTHTQRCITNNFSLNIKNRIIMINKLKAGKIRIKRIVAGLFITCSIIFLTTMVKSSTVDSYNSVIETVKNSAYGIQSTSHVSQKDVSIIDTTPPSYPGGDEARSKYIIQNLKYPDAAIKDDLEGTVYVQFTVQTDGKVTNVHILKGISPELDEASLNLIKGMPDWIPAKAGGKEVPFVYTMPLKFKLMGDSKKGMIKIDDNQREAKEDIITNKSTIAHKEPGSNIYTVVEDPPQFPGGDKARSHYLNSKIIYPEDARKKGIEGTVYINFIVQADGSITDVKILRGFNKELDEIAIDAVKSMPNWIPGKTEGKPVAVSFNIPIKFSLQDKDKKE